MVHSGDSAPDGAIGISETSYFDKIDARGLNTAQIKLPWRDDGLIAAKTIELTRQLVERDDVVARFTIVGSATNRAVLAYLSRRRIPQLFRASAPRSARSDDQFANRGAGADVFINISDARFAARAIRKAHDIGWRSSHVVTATTIRWRQCRHGGILARQESRAVITARCRDASA